MSSRHQARKDALQILYQLDMNGTLSVPQAISHYEKLYTKDGGRVDTYVEKIVNGVREHLTNLDNEVTKQSENWRMDRMAIVDRNILRIGVFELQFCDDVPATVTINEMVEIAKEYGAEATPSFINAILDKIKVKVVPAGKAP